MLRDMAVGRSKRIVIDVDDVEIKRRLHAALAGEGRSLKDWFLVAAREYLDGRGTLQLNLGNLRAAEASPAYGAEPTEKP